MAIAVLLLVIVLLAALGALGAGVWAITRSRRDHLSIATPGVASSAEIDAFALGDPWRRYVNDARKARNRFHEGIERSQEGPLRERLIDIGRQVDAAVLECWETARRGDELRIARRRIETSDIERRLADAAAVETSDGASNEAREAARRTMLALESQLDSAGRMDAIISDATSRLRTLQAQLDETVARAAELSVRTGEVAQLSSVDQDIDNVLIDLRALHEALDETDGLGGTATA